MSSGPEDTNRLTNSTFASDIALQYRLRRASVGTDFTAVTDTISHSARRPSGTDTYRRNSHYMTYVIAEPCIGTKDNSCVEVCPVDCIHPTEDEAGYEEAEQLFINPAECIDCDACVEACPVDACYAEDQVPTEWQA